MKKFMKICAITAAVIFGIGIILITVGGVGGGFRTLRSQLRDGSIRIAKNLSNWWGGLDLPVNYSLDEDNFFDDMFDIIQDSESYSHDFSGDSITNLALDLGGCTLILKDSPDTDYHVEAERIRAMQAYVSGETLHIKGLEDDFSFTQNNSLKITLSIPADTHLNCISMSLGAGDFRCSELNAESVNIEIGAGQLIIDSLETAHFACELGAGQATIKDALVKENAALEVGMGEILFTGNIPGNLSANCSMGNLTLNMTGSSEQDHNLELECAVGNLDIGGRSYSGLATKQYIDNGADSTYQLNCSMGNLTLRFQ